MRLKRKIVSDDFVDLSIGRVYFKSITNGDVQYCTSNSTIVAGAINNNLFFQLFEYKLLNLSKRKINKLSVKDGMKVRLKLKEILLRHDILKEEMKLVDEKEEEFSDAEKAWFQSRNPSRRIIGVQDGNSR